MTAHGSVPTILAIDCSQREAHVVLDHAGRVHARRFDTSAQAEREPLWDELRALFADAGARVGALGAVAVATGPGGFTGLRVAIGCAKGLAFALGVPVVEMPSAIVFAASDRARGASGPWLVALAAKQDTVWAVEVTRTSLEPGTGGSALGSLRLGEPVVVDADGFATLAGGVASRGGALLSDEHLGASLTKSLADLDFRFGVSPWIQRPSRLRPASDSHGD